MSTESVVWRTHLCMERDRTGTLVFSIWFYIEQNSTNKTKKLRCGANKKAKKARKVSVVLKTLQFPS